MYDWDRVVRDDFIGECSVNLNDLDHNRTTTLTLNLTDPAKTATSDSGAAEAELGQITLDIQVVLALNGSSCYKTSVTLT